MSPMNTHRREIDRLDRQLVALLARRMDAVRRIGRLKNRDDGSAVRDDGREGEVNRAWAEAARESGLSSYFATRILGEILGHSRRVQQGVVGRAGS